MATNSQNQTILLTPKEAADRLHISESTLAKWRMTAQYRLPFVKVGARVAYTEAAIESFIADRLRASTSEGRDPAAKKPSRRGRPPKYRADNQVAVA